MAEKFDFVPNSFQTPNDYVDKLMHLLTNPEFRCLIYATRRILGFNKRQDRIALSQFISGTRRKADGEYLDHGTGLSRQAVVDALESLTETFGLMIKTSENDPRCNEGAEYALQLEAAQINLEGLVARYETWHKIRSGQTEKARESKARSVQQTALPVCLTDTPPSVQQTAPGLSNRPGPVCPTDTQYTDLNTGLNPEETQMGANAPAPLVKNQNAFEALRSFEKTKGAGDFSAYPEQVREIIREFCSLWNLRPPAPNGRRGGEFALWISDAKELSDACGEFGLKTLRQASEDYHNLDLDRRFMVARPGAVVKLARATAAQLRDKKPAKEVESYEVWAEKYTYRFNEPASPKMYQLYLRQQGVTA